MQEVQNIDKLKVVSVDEVKHLPSMKNLSVEEAEQKIKVIKELSLSLFEILANEKSLSTIPTIRKTS